MPPKGKGKGKGKTRRRSDAQARTQRARRARIQRGRRRGDRPRSVQDFLNRAQEQGVPIFDPSDVDTEDEEEEEEEDEESEYYPYTRMRADRERQRVERLFAVVNEIDYSAIPLQQRRLQLPSDLSSSSSDRKSVV